ncbi:calcium uptake protein 3, mitochondrial isoform X2 [Octopus sinensis]|uniref:Calcium uptake protein 3, mitochondrial isoform X2 n=1 Tax=Octopus sinensis TaxID=2607531 RepID=A0A6P7TF41_9MOLL|nr:calcium uptake protein 3, mitochondrial isoform X2 [Octopus sinensis]
MASRLFRRSLQSILKNNVYLNHSGQSWNHFNAAKTTAAAFVVPTLGYLAWNEWRKRSETSGGALCVAQCTSKARGDATTSASQTTQRPLSFREQRFRDFASVEYEGHLYMTPQDFLESVLEDTPRTRIGHTKLRKQDVDEMLKKTPNKSRMSQHLFRSLHSQGIISYTEYLFLLCVLTKPRSGFRIAFNMFDADGNQIVDKREFLVLESFFALPRSEQKFIPRPEKTLKLLLSLERIFSSQSDNEKKAAEENELEASTEGSADSREVKPVAPPVSEIACRHVTDTTLLVHFFGANGTDVLNYDDFHRFMENLQTEVIQLEFTDFSKGMQRISEEDFARILLRYTVLEKNEVEECIRRVRERMPEEKGITFEEFKSFCQFLNNLDDFQISMRMYTFAEQSVSQEEFQRAVKICTGFTLGPHVVNTVFQIFDADGDGHLSHKEFISIMKDRIHRGARAHVMTQHGNWNTFKNCVKQEMKAMY